MTNEEIYQVNSAKIKEILDLECSGDDSLKLSYLISFMSHPNNFSADSLQSRLEFARREAARKAG